MVHIAYHLPIDLSLKLNLDVPSLHKISNQLAENGSYMWEKPKILMLLFSMHYFQKHPRFSNFGLWSKRPFLDEVIKFDSLSFWVPVSHLCFQFWYSPNSNLTFFFLYYFRLYNLYSPLVKHSSTIVRFLFAFQLEHLVENQFDFRKYCVCLGCRHNVNLLWLASCGVCVLSSLCSLGVEEMSSYCRPWQSNLGGCYHGRIWAYSASLSIYFVCVWGRSSKSCLGTFRGVWN